MISVTTLEFDPFAIGSSPHEPPFAAILAHAARADERHGDQAAADHPTITPDHIRRSGPPGGYQLCRLTVTLSRLPNEREQYLPLLCIQVRPDPQSILAPL